MHIFAQPFYVTDNNNNSDKKKMVSEIVAKFVQSNLEWWKAIRNFKVLIYFGFALLCGRHNMSIKTKPRNE